MAGITVYEFDALVSEGASNALDKPGLKPVPAKVFAWLELQALHASGAGESKWLRLTQKHHCRAVQVTSFVGVIRAPDNYQIEVLPKIAKTEGSNDKEVRQLLIEMLCCLGKFRHIKTANAKLMAARIPLFEIFIGEFLHSVQDVVKRGLRSDYSPREDNIFALRGKLKLASHLRHNLFRKDRFYAEFDEFTLNRPENRLLHSALKCVLKWTALHENQRLARELCFVFSEVPASSQPTLDFSKVQLNRGMHFYGDALAWARLILEEQSPLTGSDKHQAPSMLFPMEAVFEAFVEKHLTRQVNAPFTLKGQAQSLSLDSHQSQNWFRLKPDLLIKESVTNRLVLDTKWKLLDETKTSGTDKYGLSQSDFYQLYAYGHSYLNGQGSVVLIYPKTPSFSKPLPVFEYPKSDGLKLWVLPFCLHTKALALPECGSLNGTLKSLAVPLY